MARKRILFIDGDEPFVQEVASAARRRGYETIVTPSSADGCELARSEHPDLIVVSVELTPTNGWSVCTKLKKDEELRGVPVVLTSSTSTPDTFEKHKKLKTRADDYLLKPYSADDLLRVTSQLLGIEEAPPEDDLVVQDETLGAADFEVGGLDDIHVEGDEPLLNGHGDEGGEALDPLAGGADEEYAAEALPELAGETLHEEGALAQAASGDDLAAFDRSFEHMSSSGDQELAQEPLQEDELTSDLGAEFQGLDAPLAPASRPPSTEGLSDDEPVAYEDTAEQPGEQAPIFGESTSEEEAALATFDLNAARQAGEDLAHANGALDAPLEAEPTFAPPESAFAESPAEVSAAVGAAVPEHPEMTGDPTFYADAAALENSTAELPPYDPNDYEEPGRVSELEARVAELEAEVEGYRATEGSRDQDLERLREEGQRKDRESQELRDQLHEKERAFREMKEAESRAAIEAAKSRDERVRRDAAMKALTGRAEQMSAQAKRLERDALTAREELKTAGVFKTRFAELEQSSKQALATAGTELATVRAQHTAVVQQHEAAVQEKESTRQELEKLQQEHDALRSQNDSLRTQHDATVQQLEALKPEHDTLRGQHDTLRGEHDTLRGEHDTLRGEHDTLRQQHETLVQDNDVLGQQQQQTEQERDALRQQHDQAKEEVERLKAAHGQAVIDLEAARGDVEAARGDHDAARAELDELRNVVDRHIASISDLEQKLSAAEEEKESLASKARAAGDRAGRTRDTLLKLAEELGISH